MFVCGQIAVDQGFGGIESKQKALWLIDVVVDFFRDNGCELICSFILLVFIFSLHLKKTKFIAKECNPGTFSSPGIS